MLTTSSLSYALDEVVSTVAWETFYTGTFFMPALYGVRTSMKRRERGASFGGLGAFEVKVNGSEPSNDDISQQFEKDFTHVAYGKKVSIERELADDQEWGLLEDLGMQFGNMAQYTMENAAAALFADAFAGATYTAEDALSICNNAHVNVDGGNSQDNSGTSALSWSSLSTTRIAMRRFKDYRGNLAPSRGTLLIVPPDLEMTGWELQKSANKPDTANNNANYFQGAFDMIVWDFLSDTNNWFLVDPMKMKQNLLWYQRVPLEIFSTGNLLSGTKTIGGYMRFSHGCRDWRWIYGHTV